MAVVPDRPWEAGGVIFAYNAVLKVNDTDYRIYYDLFTPNRYSAWPTHYRFFCVALSRDGTTYHKPDLGLHTYPGAVPAGSRHNNIVGRQFGAVFLDANPRAPPEQLFKMITGPGATAFGSADGFNWTLISSGHIPFSDTQSAAFYDPTAHKYSVYYRLDKNPGSSNCPGGCQSSRSIGLLTTDNLSAASWGPSDQKTERSSDVDIVFAVDEFDPPCLDFYTSAATKVADATFIFPMQYLHCNLGRSASAGGLPVSAPVPCAGARDVQTGLTNDGLLDVGFAFSRNGRNFSRGDRAPFLPRGPGRPRTGCATADGGAGECPGVWEGAFDAASTAMAVGIMDRGTDSHGP
jgi:hypothetical protein